MQHNWRSRSRHIAEDTIKRSFDCESGGLLKVELGMGSISVKAGGAGKIDVTVLRKAAGLTREEAQARLNSISVEFQPDGRGLTIQSWVDERHDCVGLDFVISVPQEFNVDLTTSGGDVNVDGLVGETRCGSSGGSLRIRQTARRLVARTSGGDIRIEQTAGDDDQVKAPSEYSRLGISGEPQIRAATSGGTIVTRLHTQLAGDCRLSTSGGDIIAHLNPSVSANIRARTSGGAARVLVPVKAVQRASSTSVTAVLNDGGPTISLSTSGGDIEIRGL